MAASDDGLADQLRRRYGLRVDGLRRLDVPVNEVVEVTTTEASYALKLYHRMRTAAQVRWEAELVAELARLGAPVAAPVAGRTGLLEVMVLEGVERLAVLWEWAPGSKPSPSTDTYLRLGEAAARIHRAADELTWFPDREVYDLGLLIDDQLRRMRPLLERTGQWASTVALTERLRAGFTGRGLDHGLSHLDLTLDNVHVAEDLLTVFDFDSAGRSWRAIEPAGVLMFSDAYFADWLTGYRATRPFGMADESAVASLAVINELRIIAWRLGVAESSRGKPLLTVENLPKVVAGLLAQERRSSPSTSPARRHAD